MLIYDRGLAFGSCAGEATAWPLAALAIALILAGLARLATRSPRFAALWIVPWLLAGTGVFTAAIMVFALLGPITARLELAGPDLEVVSCRLAASERETLPASSVRGRFVLRESRRGPPTPLVELTAEDGRPIASLWLGHKGVNLEALERLAPRAVAEFRRWRDRSR